MNAGEHLQEITLSGIIVALSARRLQPSLVMVIDALLAAPMLALELQVAADQVTLLADVLALVRGKMVVGVLAETEREALAALAVGAHFVSTPSWNTAVAETAQSRQRLYLPGCTTVAGAKKIAARGPFVIRWRQPGKGGPESLKAVRHACPTLPVIVAAEYTAAMAQRYRRGGAMALLAYGIVRDSPDQTMSAIITRARKLQQAWDNDED